MSSLQPSLGDTVGTGTPSGEAEGTGAPFEPWQVEVVLLEALRSKVLKSLVRYCLIFLGIVNFLLSLVLVVAGASSAVSEETGVPSWDLAGAGASSGVAVSIGAPSGDPSGQMLP